MSFIRSFGGYEIHDCLNHSSLELSEKIVDLWRRNKILPPEADPQNRVKQAVVVALDKSKEAIGVNTVYPQTVPVMHQGKRLGLPSLMYRTFIQPEDRVPLLFMEMLKETFDLLESSETRKVAKSFLIVGENPSANRPGAVKLLERNGFKPWRKNPKGQLVFRRDFEPK